MITELGLDIETTGLLAPEHRIIEIYFQGRKDGVKIFEWETRIDPKRSITAEAQRVHGIDYTALIGKPVFEDVAKNIHMIISKFDVMIAHNGENFDWPFLAMELKRCGLIIPDKPMIDTMVEGVWATPDGKKPTLAELCFATGIDYDPSKAHAASYDVSVMMDAFEVGRKLNFFPEIGSVTALAA